MRYFLIITLSNVLTPMNKQTVQNTPGQEFFNSDAFTQLFYRSPVPKCVLSAETKQFITVNKQYLKLTGFNEDELLGVDSRTIGLVGFDEADTTIAAATESSYEVAIPLVISTKNNEKRSVLVYIYEFDIGLSDESYIIASLVDLTERERIAKLFRQEKEFKEKVIESINDGMVITDLSGTCIDVNPALIGMTGFKREELVGTKAPFKYWPPEYHDEILSYFYKAREGKQNTFSVKIMRKDGERFPASVVTSRINDKDGRLIAMLATIKNITEQVQVESMLRETAEKSNQRKKAILELASLVGSDYYESLKKITSLASRVLNVERVSVWKFNEGRSEIECEKLFNKSDSSFEKGAILKKEDNPAYFETLSKNKTINVSDAVNDPITKAFIKEYLTPNKITSLLDVFIQGQGEYYGIICFENVGSIREWSADEEEFATSVANLVSLMVQSRNRMIAEEKLQKLNVTLSNTVTELNELKNKLEHENVYLRKEIEMVFNFEEMVYGSDVFSKILTEVEQVAPTKATVLLLGETGTGKELLARAIHNLSDRKDFPLIKVNCAAIPQELIESELFGHKKGSFTGAIADKIGKIELADGGTLFLDEIGELPLTMQPKLLRFLQEGEIEKIGDPKVCKLDVRVIAATNKNLIKEVAKKRFREDLYFRLNVFPIVVPPLRKRKEDIPILIEHFVDKFSKIYRKKISFISDNSMREMQSYHWPGNIRELENLIERAVILSNSTTLKILEFETEASSGKRPVKHSNLSLNEAQRIHILNVLEKSNWKIDGPNVAAVMLDIKPSTLRDRMKKLKIQRPH